MGGKWAETYVWIDGRRMGLNGIRNDYVLSFVCTVYIFYVRNILFHIDPCIVYCGVILTINTRTSTTCMLYFRVGEEVWMRKGGYVVSGISSHLAHHCRLK